MARVDSRKHVLAGGVHTGAIWRIPLNRPCAAAMQPFCQITLTNSIIYLFILIRMPRTFNIKMLQDHFTVAKFSGMLVSVELNVDTEVSSSRWNVVSDVSRHGQHTVTSSWKWTAAFVHRLINRTSPVEAHQPVVTYLQFPIRVCFSILSVCRIHSTTPS